MTLTQIKRQEMDSQVGLPTLSLLDQFPVTPTPSIIPMERSQWERDLGRKQTEMDPGA